MYLYRLCNEEEAKTILETKDFSSLGSNYRNCFKNNFIYEPDKKYLHFFDSPYNIYFLHTRKNHYICTYDIPEEVLPKKNTCYNIDFLDYENHGDVDEYVIESNKIIFDYLYDMDKILENIDYEDYLYTDLSKLLETVYDKNRVLKYEKKLY